MPRPPEPEPESVAEEPAAERPRSDWFAPRKPAAPGVSRGPAGPDTPAGFAGPPDPGGAGGGERPGLPYFSKSPQRGAGAGVAGPTGPTTGPVAGTSSLKPPLDAWPAGESLAVPPPMVSDDTAVLTPQQPIPEFPPGARYPQPQGPVIGLEQDGPFGPASENVSGHTLSSGIPVVPAEHSRSPFPPGPAGGAGSRSSDGTSPYTPSLSPSLESAAVVPSPDPAPPATPGRKGRSKLGTATAGLVILAGITYGAGLLMNHSDVPKGTTVLGVDIGGGTRDEAVNKLDDAFGKRVNTAAEARVDGRKTVELRPATRPGVRWTPRPPCRRPRQRLQPGLGDRLALRQAAGRRAGHAGRRGEAERRADRPGGRLGLGVRGHDQVRAGQGRRRTGKAGKGSDVGRLDGRRRDAYRTQVETGTRAPSRCRSPPGGRP